MARYPFESVFQPTGATAAYRRQIEVMTQDLFDGRITLDVWREEVLAQLDYLFRWMFVYQYADKTDAILPDVGVPYVERVLTDAMQVVDSVVSILQAQPRTQWDQANVLSRIQGLAGRIRRVQTPRRNAERPLGIILGAIGGVSNLRIGQLPVQEQRRINPRQIQDVNPEDLQTVENVFTTLAERYLREAQRGDITVAEWRDLTGSLLKDTVMAGRIVGVNGVNNLTTADLDYVSNVTRRHLAYLDRFSTELVEKDLSLLTTGELAQIRARLRMYGRTSRQAASVGNTDARGMPRLPAYPGSRTSCLNNCGCSWQIRELSGTGNWDCTWVRSKSDSCDECFAREDAFAPLRIRNFELQQYSTAGIYT